MNASMRRMISGMILVALWQLPKVSAQSQELGRTPSGSMSTRPKVVLVELFTSEGCSDCPPADDLLRRIDRKQTDSGQLIVGISEHVTYWNHLGWSDPFSLDIYSQRQSVYGNRFGLDSVYTPQMVVNGSEQFVGSDSASLAKALRREEEQQPSIVLNILSAKVANGALNVTYSATGEFASQGLDLVAVLADDADRSSVSRGENSGRSLTHVAVARSLTHVTKLTAQTESTARLPLPPSFQGSQAHHVILFAQNAGNGRVVGTDTKAF
jgi:hypothetical protein